MPGDHVLRNRSAWDDDAASWVEPGRRAWSGEPTWGVWWVPDTRLQLLPDDVAGMDVVELGCGTGYLSAWLARRGARPVGLDNSGKQLETARMLQREFGLEFPLVHADAENLPFADETFDLAVSEYGAALWCDPYAWIPEAARVLRAGGRLLFLTNSYLATLAGPGESEERIDERLRRPQFGADRRYEWEDEASIEFHIAHGEMIEVLRGAGFEVEALVEIRAPDDAVDNERMAWLSAEWSRRWPSEEAWKAIKR
jgi:SAM-dependent methyltransferase